MRGGALDLVDETQHVGHGQAAETGRQRQAAAPRDREGFEETVERSILTEEQELVFAAEVVVQVAG
jgi:hypothetical protein